MKSTLILSALTTGSLALQGQLNALELENLLARAIDPQDLDPVRYSVLSVLHTAIPSGAPLPTSGPEPDWYRDLPEEVKSLLPILYPTVAAVATPTPASSTPPPPPPPAYSAAPVESKTPTPVPAPTPSSSHAPYPTTESSIAPLPSLPVYHNTSTPILESSSSSPASKSNITKTVHLTQTLSVNNNRTTATSTSIATGGGAGATPGSSASPSPSLSGSSKNGFAVEVLAVLAWMGVGAGFMVFA